MDDKNRSNQRMDLKKVLKDAKFSQSEENGLRFLSRDFVNIYCPGISTSGIAEIKMANMNPKRKITATTIDESGLESIKSLVKYLGLENQIELKFEDVSKPLLYKNNLFDFVYARLILDYLDSESLDKALKELYRILKPNGLIYIVVRSTDDPDSKTAGTRYDPRTKLTTYLYRNEKGQYIKNRWIKRYFHTQDSIKSHLLKAGFKINHIDQYYEQLYLDFDRSQKSPQENNVIEVLAHKP